jgi:hypothetical protein
VKLWLYQFTLKFRISILLCLRRCLLDLLRRRLILLLDHICLNIICCQNLLKVLVPFLLDLLQVLLSRLSEELHVELLLLLLLLLEQILFFIHLSEALLRKPSLLFPA